MVRKEHRQDRRRAGHDSPWGARKSWAVYQHFAVSAFWNLIATKDSSIAANPESARNGPRNSGSFFIGRTGG